MPYFTMMSGCFFLGILATQLKESPMLVLALFIEFLLYVTVHVLGVRYKNLHVYGVLLCYTVTSVNVMFALFFYRNFETDVQRDLTIRTSFEYMARTGCFFCLYGVPNGKFLIVYILIYLSVVTILTLNVGDFNNAILGETISMQPAYIVALCVIFHITHNLRLNRFFKEKSL